MGSVCSSRRRVSNPTVAATRGLVSRGAPLAEALAAILREHAMRLGGYSHRNVPGLQLALAALPPGLRNGGLKA